MPISIIGGGLAGLTLGIALRQRSVPVTISEAGKYPRHRVCGEFISGRGQAVLKRLGLFDLVLAGGARTARTAAFHSEDRRYPVRVLPESALCISRYALDALLAESFLQLEGTLQSRSRCTNGENTAGTVYACGRRAESVVDGSRWFGLKAHARGIAMDADLEMHLSRDAYVGLCQLGDNEVNVCGLLRSHHGNGGSARSAIERLTNVDSTILRRRLATAEWIPDSACSIGGLSLRPRLEPAAAECRIGDALTMIAPMSGNGMSMAFESAELAVEPLLAYSRGELSWTESTRGIAQRCRAAFTRRVKWAWVLQRCAFAPLVRPLALPVAVRLEPAWRFLFAATR
jgi:2-polyprenyl-6-methoxyphenol hydroxylase-like FAD-dependent oxidoreductase